MEELSRVIEPLILPAVYTMIITALVDHYTPARMRGVYILWVVAAVVTLITSSYDFSSWGSSMQTVLRMVVTAAFSTLIYAHAGRNGFKRFLNTYLKGYHDYYP